MTAMATTTAQPETAPLVVEGLTTTIRLDGATYEVVRDIGFSVGPRETLALVGESGCGKSMTALSVMGLLPAGIASVSAGKILIDGTDMVAASEATRQGIRGNRIGMIFQEPMTSLNPVLPIGFQVGEALIEHQGFSRRAARERARELLELVRLPAARSRLDDYPHQFSGGMRQRVMIALALACRPKVLIADEPTTALDVTIQAQVLALLNDLQVREGLAVLLITHNLGVVASVADRVMVMYGGDVVESGDVAAFFAEPSHPYSIALLAAMPRIDGINRPQPIPGQVPSIDRMPSGCRFQSRCPLREDRCVLLPPLTPVAGNPNHRVRCWVKGGA